MKLTVEDMKKGEEAKKFYAVKGEEGTKAEEHQNVEIATIERNGGEANEKYSCDVTVNITTTDEKSILTTPGALGSGNAKLYLSGLMTKELDLTEESSKSYTETVNLDTPGTTNSLKADLEITNSMDDQSKAAGATLSVKLVTSVANCKLVSE